ncbi:MAG: GAF domain-containing protein [Candidatus Limnocylindrales bacterium]
MTDAPVPPPGAARHTALLAAVAVDAAAQSDLSGVLDAALTRLAEQVAITGGSIALVEGDLLVIRAASGPFAAGTLGARVGRRRGHRSWQVAETGKPIMVADTDAAPELEAKGSRPALTGGAPRIRSTIAVPLHWQDRLLGVLEVDSTRPHAFGPEQLELVQAVASAIAGPIEMAERRGRDAAAGKHLEAATRRLSLLARAGALVGTTLDDEATLRGLADILVPDVADFCVIDLVEVDGTVRRVAAVHVDRALGDVMAEALEDPPRLGGAGDVAAALGDGQPRLIDPVGHGIPWSSRDPVRAARLRRLGLRSIMIVPLVGREGVLAALTVGVTGPERRYDQDDLDFALILARRAAAAIDNARLYHQLARFKAAVDATADGVFMIDPATLRFTYANHGAVLSLGLSEAALLGAGLTDLIAHQDEARLRETVASLRRGAEPSTFVATYRRRDGSEFPGEAFLQLVEVGGADRLVAIVRDVSERVEARARLQRLAESERSLSAELRAIIQAFGDGVLVFAADGRLALANPAIDTLLGAPPSDLAALLARFEDGAGERPGLARLIDEAPLELLLSGRPGAAGPIVPRHWVEVSAYAFAPGGEPVGGGSSETLVLLRDVTEARDRRLTHEAFFGVLSHELRTPVTTIYGNSKLLARAARRSARVRTEALLDIESEAERLYRLVEDLLVLGRFEEGPRSKVAREPVPVQRLVAAAVAAEAARRPAQRFVSRLPADLPPASGEATSVEQVLRNLIGNATKYSPGGTITVTAASDGAAIAVRVLDEGPGLAGADADRLFELFYRAPDTARLAAGAGIGLFVCKRLVEAMGGRIWARSRPGHRGAEFGFTLPPFTEEEA